MKIEENDILLKIYIGESDKYKGRPLYEQITMQAKNLGLSGLTVFKGILGFGADKRMHTSKLLNLSDDLPLLIEIIDKKDNIDKIIPFLDQSVKEGLVTMESIHVIRYRSH